MDYSQNPKGSNKELPQNQKASNRDLQARVEKLESTVQTVCYTLYELIEHLRGMKSNKELVAIPPPECPPICARPEEESR